MPILKYVPPIKKIIDHRSDKGGYYEAICENCGTTFYPERSNAKYCSPNCGLIQHRKAKAEILARGGSIKPAKPTKKLNKAEPIEEFRGVIQVYQYLKNTCNTHGQKETIINDLNDIEVGSYYTYEGESFLRFSPGKWYLVESK